MGAPPKPPEGHRWSGWPGAFCLRCGVEHAWENALAMNWVDIDASGHETWDTEEHRLLVLKCDTTCSADNDTSRTTQQHRPG
jgi:hypothetical protein